MVQRIISMVQAGWVVHSEICEIEKEETRRLAAEARTHSDQDYCERG